MADDETAVDTHFMPKSVLDKVWQLPRQRDLGDRILFGSDFPNIPYTYADAMRSITRVPGIDDAWLRGVLYENAAALFSPTAQP